jgi:lysosomal Pro-X carboxypeptidase
LYPINAAGSVFYNYADQLECLDVSVQQGGGLDDNGWGVLACNEMVMPFASNPDTSMFPSAKWSDVEDTSYCEAAYGLRPQYGWALEYFGGQNPKKDFMKASNIVFSNGELDPWQAGGITFDVSPETTPLYIEHSAHHLDLRLPNVADPQSLTDAR